MNRRFPVLLLAALCGGINQSAFAQVAPQDPSTTVGETKKTRFLRLKNVTPSVMAWWLDPAHHKVPIEFAGVKSLPSDSTPKGTVSLPEGIEGIVAIDPQKSLLVFGTQAGFDELQKIVGFLDRPQRQAEIETQLVKIQLDAIDEFKFQNGKAADGKSAPTGFLRGDFQATIAKLVAQNKAKFMGAPHSTTLNNNVPLEVGFIMGAPVAAKAKKISHSVTQLPQGQGYKNLFLPFVDPDTVVVAQPLQENGGFRLLMTPTINNDDTITLLMSSDSKTESAERIAEVAKGFNAIANLRDGDTAAFVLLSMRFSNGEAAGDTLLLVATPRIVRRLGDENSTAAPKP